MIRNEILNFLMKELVGPDPVKPHIQANGEEILLNEPPRMRYGAGILYPSPDRKGKGPTYAQVDCNDQEEEQLLQKDGNIDVIENSDFEENNTSSDVAEDFEEEIGLANNFLPSALGFSCFTRVPQVGFIVKIKCGIYELREYSYKKDDGKIVTKKAYHRIPIEHEFVLNKDNLPLVPNTSKAIPVTKDDNSKGLTLNVRNRTHGSIDRDISLLTFTLINYNIGNTESIHNEDCFFQVSLSLESKENCFYPYKTATSASDKDDERSNQLLFRKKKTFAVGHGCSPKWNDLHTDSTNKIETEIIPSYEIKPIVPNELKSIHLRMKDLSDLSEGDITVNLDQMASEYEKWIISQEQIASKELNHELLQTAQRHIENCRSCLRRIKEGINLLRSNTQVLRAFKLMNRAMLLQQLHYSIELREWQIDKGVITGLKNATIPDINNPQTWKPHLGSWRPFQLAFILMNLTSILDNDHKDREMVDLIWFPTGGGKTEAYLGLSAFTIFLRRLKNPEDSGTTVLMRYTLRLLTAQQFQRAASLICACEKIRSENQDRLGTHRITIGMWVGESLSPIYRQDALKAFKKMEDGREESNPFIILKCPWCGCQMGYLRDAKKNKVKGYKRRKISGKDTVVYQCDNGSCEFSKENFNLPFAVIDEDIYSLPPTILIGTVDKFAMLTWRPEARSLFGFRDETIVSPPELIIQDELHLISGPLGSMVGLYETLIEELCMRGKRKPKIIASSATISRAKEQINSLYGRGTQNVTIFPPQCLNAGDSFFAYEENNSENAPGRLYVGVFASALSSHATAQVRVISSLLQSALSLEGHSKESRDPYWTLLSYFNSIRELGHAATLIRADIREYMNSMWIRKGIPTAARRFINNDKELTSRINSDQITDILEELLKEYPTEKYPIDICLATNMISVGVDIPRLGIMTVIGQPKTTSEYIQATSRVGRSKKGPGLVVTIYNTSKPRDRSHYEHFQEYHSKIYSKVEPTSVTPFSSPARQRALHAILVGLIRFYSEPNRDRPTPIPTAEVFDTVCKLIKKRVTEIDGEEVDATMLMLADRISKWKNYSPIIYGSFSPGDSLPLMYPAGTSPSEQIRLRAWSTPTSMRNVDATCDAIVVNEYTNIDR
jgi:hypothetical protein